MANVIIDPASVEIGKIVENLGVSAQRRAGALALDDHLRVLRKREYPGNVEINGAEAGDYLRKCATEVERLLRSHASAYSGHKWLWFLRRLPDSLFTFAKFSNPAYDRAVTETAVGMFAAASLQLPDSYRVEETTVRRAMRFCGMAAHLSDIQGALQWAGTTVRFRFTDRPIPDPLPLNREDDAIELYVNRLDSELPMFTRLGVITSLDAPKKGAPIIAPLFRNMKPEVVNLRRARFPFDAEVLSTYRPLFVSVEDIVTFLSDKTLRSESFPRSIAANLLLHRVMLMLAFAEVAYPAQMLLLGYCHTPLSHFNTIANRLCADWAEFLSELPTAIARPSGAVDLLAELQAVTPSLHPLQPGPIVSVAGDRLLIDLAAACTRLYADLEFPATSGPVANYRSHYFEIMLQDVIDRTPVAPSAAIRELRGKTLRVNGAALTDVDAVAETASHILLVSCKSIPYSARYDAGDYAVVRNVQSLVVAEIAKHAALVQRINNSSQGDNYEFQKPVIGVVCTPHVVLIPVGDCTTEILPGLRIATSASELLSWCQRGSAA
jgi:hypothetical protein